jgi:uncharacterized protein
VTKQRRIPEATKDELNKIVKKIIAAYQPEKIILFGSYAYGKPSANSDLDLLIIKKTGERFIDRWTNVRKIVSDPERSISFEPLILTPQELEERLARGDQFIEEIMARGEVLYAA